MEIFICTIISINSLSSEILINSFDTNWSDSFSICASFIVLALIICIPIYIIYIINKEFKNIDKKKVKLEIGLFFEDMSTDTKV